MFFDTGRDQLIAFMEPRGVPGVPLEYDAGINRGLGTPAAFYHFAFEAGSPSALEDKRRDLLAKGGDGKPKWLTMDGRNRSISKIPMVSRSNSAACCATSPRTTP